MRRLAFAAALALACGTDNPPAFSTGPGVTSVAHTSTSSGGESSTSTSTSTSTGGEDSNAGNSGGVSTFDVQPPPDLDDPTPEGCKGKIDFVFVISALYTMRHEQDQLLASFPGFVETISAGFVDFDAHVISINTDESWRGDLCESPDWCLNMGNCGPTATNYECGKYVDEVGPCDETRGAGLVFNAGGYAYNKPCHLFGGNRYIIDGEPNQDAFQCIAQVGCSGGNVMADSLVAALSPELNGPGGCNAGFLRDDALLVVVFITDTEDEKSSLSAKQVRDAVVAVKGGDDHAVVMLLIGAQWLVGDPVPDCVYEELPGNHLRDVIELFPFHDEGDICANSYAPFFNGAAASLVHDACTSFIPQ